MKQALLVIFLVIFCVVIGEAQTVTDCPHPSGCVVLSREAALKALADSDRVAALEAEIKAKDQAIADIKQLLADMRVNYAETQGENTILKQRAVSDAAIIELLMKFARKKCLPLSVCF